jgi:drug/metabolite transporter (DMT)-like permease
MTKLILIMFVSLSLEAIGVVMLSRGLKEIGGVDRVSVREVVRVARRAVTNRYILVGMLFETLFFAGMVTMMAQADVSFVWPLSALGLVLTTLAAQFFLHEEVSRTRWGGVILMMAGAALITYSEKVKERKPPPSAPPAALIQQP